MGIGIPASNIYRVNVNGNFNATNIYNNGTLINFNSYAIQTEVNDKFLLYPTLIYTSNTYLTISTFNSNIADYTKTGLDLNYLNVNSGGNVNGLTTFSNLNASNLNISNILNVNNNLTVLNTITSSNINVNNINASNINISNINASNINISNINSSNIRTSNINTSNLYINDSIINFNSYAVKTDVDAKFLLYSTLIYTSNTYHSISSFNSVISF